MNVLGIYSSLDLLLSVMTEFSALKKNVAA